MARVLVIGQVALNRARLRAMLEPAGHEVVEADSAEAALAAAAAQPSDLVLIDATIPGTNSLAAAARLKQAASGSLPVVVVTSLDVPSSRLLALRVGADDFVTTPVDRHELEARCNNLVRLRSQERELALRHQQLVELRRFADEMAALLVHDLKNPMAVVLSNLEYVLTDAAPLSHDLREALIDARSGANHTLRLLANLLDLSRLESSRLPLQRKAITVRQLLRPLVAHRARLVGHRGIALVAAVGDELLAIDADLVARVLENVLDNALRYTPAEGRLQIATRDAGAMLELRIGNSGPPVPPEARRRIFEKYTLADGAMRTNLGLGLYFCRLVVEAHGGKMTVDDEPELPTVFALTLPRG